MWPGALRAGDAGRFWTWAAEPCATWPAQAANRYTGPWNNPTAHTILLVGTLYDPSTPYRDSQALAKELANARLLTHHGYGHTALVNPSSCVNDYESRYLIEGTLPPAGAACQQDTPPFAATRPQGGVATGGGAMAGIAS
ncbi:alpha/beta hydrolase [Streptomyces sp. MS1.AVA.3]|uniref:alpha/beta hydrolase n=1 Tax=Streptomyces decoyicus TaxID=249567 RepID=UPI0030C60270